MFVWRLERKLLWVFWCRCHHAQAEEDQALNYRCFRAKDSARSSDTKDSGAKENATTIGAMSVLPRRGSTFGLARSH